MHTFSEEKRTLPDRRLKPTPLFSRYTLMGGRRRTIRRDRDRKRHLFVDIYDTRLFIVLVLLLVMNVLDGFLTLLLIRENIIVEANPLMAYCLDYGHMPFFWVKYSLMAVSLVIFCVLKNVRFSRVALTGSFITYASVLVYELCLVYAHHPQLFPD